MPEDQSLNQIKLGFRDLIKNPKVLILIIGIVLLLTGLLKGSDLIKKASSWFTKDMISQEEYKRVVDSLSSSVSMNLKLSTDKETIRNEFDSYKKSEEKNRNRAVALDGKGNPIRDADGKLAYNTVSSSSSASSGEHSEQYWQKEIELRDDIITQKNLKISQLESSAITQTTNISSHKESEEQRNYMVRITGGVLLTSELKPKACLGLTCDVITIPLINIPVAAGAWYSPPL